MASDTPADADSPPPLPDYPVPPALINLPSPPSHSDIFSLATSSSIDPAPSTDDPRVSLRSPPPPSDAAAEGGAHADPPAPTAPPPDGEPTTLTEFRKHEGSVKRLSRLRSLFDSIPAPQPIPSSPSSSSSPPATPSAAQADSSSDSHYEQRRAYHSELWSKCGAAVAASVSPTSPSSSSSPSSTAPAASAATTGSPETEAQRQSALKALRWKAFEQYADEKETELWKAFCELDRDGDRRLGRNELLEACRRAGIEIADPRAVEEFVKAVDRNGDGVISFDEWRDFLLLLPRPSTMKEIWRFYQTHRLDRPSMSRLTQDGDVVVGRGKSGWNKLLGRPGVAALEQRAAATAAKKDERDRARQAAEAVDLRRAEEREENAERAYVEAEARARAERRSEAQARMSAIEAAHDADAQGGGGVSSAKLAFEDSGVAAVASEVEDAPPRPLPSLEEKRVGEEGARHDGEEEEEDHSDEPTHGMFAGAGKFLLAGGMAGAVSRTATAPFDRLKVYLITSPACVPSPAAASAAAPQSGKKPRPGAGSLVKAVRAVYAQGGGIKAFWTGNGLNIVKIFPESAIKFLSYESAKRIFAQYWDRVPDQTLISNSSRFVAGGIGGVVSQFCIYPIESLKTRVMSSSGSSSKRGNALIVQTARDMWSRGRLRFFFRGLPAGLIGVFPYSAIDMSTFEGIKLAYTKWAGEEPGIAGSLAFGALSGGIGATSVYPLNLVRTRLQAQGTPAHPQTYTGIRDAAMKCYAREGWRGFYKGLTPTLVKVVPAVAISYAVYDTSKKILFAQDEPVDTHADAVEEE
ncbi:hypothetical protein JCM10207_008826 [Rhodosporidiobolus poonsookiae]